MAILGPHTAASIQKCIKNVTVRYSPVIIGGQAVIFNVNQDSLYCVGVYGASDGQSVQTLHGGYRFTDGVW